MTSAELIVKQYLDRGYSLESLRLLAESREQPLGAAMLAVIDRIEGDAEMVACEEDSGPCETAVYPVSDGDEEGVFFVADDEAEVSGMDGIDFDVMADTAGEAPASLEESVAEVLVGDAGEETAHAPQETEALAAGLTDSEKQGLWSRLWTRVAAASTAEAQYGPCAAHAADAPAEEPAADENAGMLAEISASEALCEAIMEESVAEVEPEMSFEPAVAPEAIANDEQEEEQMLADADGPMAMENEDPAAVSLDAEEDGETMEAAAQSEISSDYLPGSAADLYDTTEEFNRERIEEQKRRLLEAQEALQETVEAQENAVVQEDDAAEDEAMLSFESDVVAMDEVAPPAENEPEAEVVNEPEAAVEEPVAEQNETFEPEAVAEDEIAEETENESAAEAQPETEAIAEEPAAELSMPLEPEAEMQPEALVEEPAASEEMVATTIEQPEDLAAQVSVPAAPSLSEAKRSARRERRRERARKRKEKRDAVKAAADLPEIVLSSSEGTETLSILDEAVSGEAEAAPMLPALAADVADEPAAFAEEAAPPMGEAMGLITPMDVFEDDSQIIDEPAAAVSEEEEAVENPLEALIALSAEQEEVQDEAAAEDDAAFYAGGDDHLMIIANGGAELEQAEEADPEAAEERNVILFSQMFPAFVGVADGEEEEEEASLPAENYLRMLPFAQAEESDEMEEAVEEAEPVAEALAEPEPLAAVAEAAAAPEAPAQMDDYLSEATRLDLLRMFYGAPEPEDAVMDELLEDAGSHSLVVSIDPEPTVDELLAKEAAIRSEMEQEYQIRLDGFACRLLDVQAASVVCENALREKRAELATRDTALEEVKNRLDEMEKREKELLARIEAADAAGREKDTELGRFQGMRDEHQRLYNEFEDLRKAYNEVVSDVMPGLQQERDDLAFTVERQCGEEKELRSTLGSARRRLAVGYSLGAAAAAMLVALPVMNWFKSSGHEKELALEHQKVSELRENLQREVRQNIDGKNMITELENKVKMARTQINQLQNKNQELVRIQQDAAKNAQGGLAVFKPTESGAVGTPTRTTTMALQGTPAPGGRLHVNEVRDPAGSIEQTVTDNRVRNAAAPQMAAIPLNSVARSDSRNGTTRPNTQRPNGTQQPEQKKASAPVAREGEVLATVKSGEGVAQVVYRQLGTWDPEVVRWVIQENKIKTDKRGNPVIHPNQVLRLPKDGRAGQAASAARR